MILLGKNTLIYECYTNQELEKYYKSENYKNGIDIENLKRKQINKYLDNLIIIIYLGSDKKKMVKDIKKLIRYRKILAKNISILKIVLVNYEEQNQIHKQFKELLEPIYTTNIYNIYDKAYDLSCDYLDSYFYGKNLCNFCNNKCGYKVNFELNCGCCRHFEKHKQFGLLFFEKLVPCNNLGSDGRCTIKCIRCKLFSCDYLRKKGVHFSTNSIFSLYAIFNPIQRLILNSIAYTDKPDVLKIVMFFR